MIEKYSIYGAGLALLDLKSQTSQSKVEKYAGGITPNVIATINSLNLNNGAVLFACVGDDYHGNYYQNDSPSLVGIKVLPGASSGYSENLFDGYKVIKSKTNYNCAPDFEITDKDLMSNGRPVFITDVFTLQIKEREEDIQRMADYINDRNGFFALNLAGVTHLQQDVSSLLTSLHIKPHLIFGNTKEYTYLRKMVDPKQAFSESIVQIETQGGHGSHIKYRNSNVIEIKPKSISESKIVNEYGAGDTYMGTFISGLFSKDETIWNPNLMNKIADVSSIAASLVLQTRANRLEENDIFHVRSLLKKI